MNHGFFLRMIFEQLEEAIARLLCADWLDEHAAGGGLIRVRHRLTLPIRRNLLIAFFREVFVNSGRGLPRSPWKWPGAGT
jgi:uncharacterized protein (TIGR02996 family)